MMTIGFKGAILVGTPAVVEAVGTGTFGRTVGSAIADLAVVTTGSFASSLSSLVFEGASGFVFVSIGFSSPSWIVVDAEGGSLRDAVSGLFCGTGDTVFVAIPPVLEGIDGRFGAGVALTVCRTDEGFVVGTRSRPCRSVFGGS